MSESLARFLPNPCADAHLEPYRVGPLLAYNAHRKRATDGTALVIRRWIFTDIQ
jgi:hypothetical protein